MTSISVGQEGRTRQEQRSAASRAALLEGALRVLEECGYNDATVQLITRAAHRSHGAFYLHFQNKEAIYAALLAEMRERLHEESRAVWDPQNPLGSVRRSIELYVRSFERDRALWHILDGSSGNSALFQEARAALRRSLVSDIRKGIDRARQTHLDGLDPDLVAEILGAMLDQTCVTLLLYGEQAKPDAVISHIATLWGRMLGYGATDADADADGSR